MDLSLSPEQTRLAEDLRGWLAEHLELPPPFGSLEEEMEWGRRWQLRLSEAHWLGLSWPKEYGGRGLSPIDVAIFNMEYAASGAPQPVNRVGLNLVGPTLIAHGTEEQKRRFLPKILSAEEIWCQLFSEPNAGSDLASLTTSARPVRGGWVLNGQKVWNSYAQFARWGIGLARTDPELPKHQGISFFVVDMQADGVRVNPLRQITGEAEFSEVFLDEVFVPADRLVGDLNHGWEVANTTLAHERGTTFPFKEQILCQLQFGEVFRAAQASGQLLDALVADRLAQVYVELRLLGWTNLRTMSQLARGINPGPESSQVKLIWSNLTQRLSELALDLAPTDRLRQRQYLWSKSASIAGGTSEIQREIIAGRILGLRRQ